MTAMIQLRELETFIRETLWELGTGDDGELTLDTSLLRSGLFDSIAVLKLVAWIEGQVGIPMNATAINPFNDLDSMREILRYCAEHTRPTGRTDP